MVEFAPQLLGLLHAKSIDFVLVNPHELPILIEHLAVDDGGAAVLALHAEEHVPVHVLMGEGGEGLVIHDDHVGGRAGLEHPIFEKRSAISCKRWISLFISGMSSSSG